MSAGGDQGRDFETFRTYLKQNPLTSSWFAGLATDRTIVFACTLQKKALAKKVQSDVESIVNSGTPVDEIVIFVESDVPVAKRHQWIQRAKDQHNVEVQVFDGQSIAHHLSAPDTFWIAQKYLDIPSDLAPSAIVRPEGWYEELRDRWSSEDPLAFNFSDFESIRSALRRASFDSALKPDLPFWIQKISVYRSSESPQVLQKRAVYEVVVASLRGLGSAADYEGDIREYFASIEALESLGDLQDAVALLNYMATATRIGEVYLTEEEVDTFAIQLNARLSDLLESTRVNRCALLELQGYLAVVNGKEDRPDLNRALDCWGELIELVSSEPLFPLERFADFLTIASPIFESIPDFCELTAKCDELLAERFGPFHAADKCRDRAIKCFENNQFTAAIAQLQRAKVRWFAAETLPLAALSMLLLSNCYLRLGLFYAAKYYALSVSYMASKSEENDVRRLLPSALFTVANAEYGAGDSFSFLTTLRVAALAHYGFAQRPFDPEAHEAMNTAIAHSALLRQIVRNIAPDRMPFVESQLERVPWEEDILEAIQQVELPPLEAMSPDQVWDQLSGELGGPPFADCGEKRQVRWRALGIQWTATFPNVLAIVPSAEEFLAGLQVLLAELGGEDLCLLPTTVELVFTNGLGRFEIRDKSTNEGACWEVLLRTETDHDEDDRERFVEQIVAPLLQILDRCSVLRIDQYQARVESLIQDGLPSRIYNVRSYSEIYRYLIDAETFSQSERRAFPPLGSYDLFGGTEHPELAWVLGAGPGYSLEASKQAIANRYRHALRPVARTLRTFRSCSDFVTAIQELRAMGYLDWHLLLAIANIVGNYRAAASGASDPASMQNFMVELFARDEAEGDLEVPVEKFSKKVIESQLQFNLPLILQSWGLESRQHTPDLDAIQRFLDARYGYRSDDVDHEPLL